MKSFKKKIIALLCIIAALLIACAIMVSVNKYNDSKKTIANWKKTALSDPKIGGLNAAGYIDITWKTADEIGNVSGYKLYVDDKLECESDKKTLTHEFYSSKIGSHDLYIETSFEDGSVLYSNIFTFYVTKKGLCVNTNMGANIEPKDMKVGWYYNWDMTPFKFNTYKDVEYVPMMWGYNDTNPIYLERMANYGYKYLLSYNEPDLAGQADIPLDKAVESWPDFMLTKMRVSSPATALCPPWSDEWFQPFMKEVGKNKDISVDFIAYHHYWNWYTEEGVEEFLDLVDQTYEMYHKPIWITEFALSGNPGVNEEQLNFAYEYMKGILKGLDERDYVERYAWFSFNEKDKRNGASSLFDVMTGEFTKLGQLYADSGNPEGYGDDSISNNIENKLEDNMK